MLARCLFDKCLSYECRFSRLYLFNSSVYILRADYLNYHCTRVTHKEMKKRRKRLRCLGVCSDSARPDLFRERSLRREKIFFISISFRDASFFFRAKSRIIRCVSTQTSQVKRNNKQLLFHNSRPQTRIAYSRNVQRCFSLKRASQTAPEGAEQMTSANVVSIRHTGFDR